MAKKRRTPPTASEPPPPDPHERDPASAEPDPQGPAFPIVAIGASAGGLEAFADLLGHLPPDTGMAFVVVQHLAPAHESHLSEILQRATAMPVGEVHDEPRVEPNRVYVIPPDRNMVIAKGRLALVERDRGQQNRPIDLFMRHLAEDQRHLAIGVVLSGMAADGSIGVQEIKASGGITFAQDESAQQPSMPRSAVATGCVDFVLSPQGIAEELARIASHPFVARAPRLDPASVAEDPVLPEIFAELHRVTGVDFTQYKTNTLHRRIARRIVLHRLDGLRAYAKLLQQDPAEVEALYRDILISVTSFFRNPEAFEALKTRIFPRFLEGRSRHDPVRVWVLGCSSGEETYSIAMCFAEVAEDLGSRVPVQIFSTDLNGEGIERARSGVYAKGIAQDVSPERRRRFFVEVDGGYRIAKPIRDMCVFARHNVLTDPPFSRIDLVTCRNLLIYLQPPLQQRALEVFHYALKPGGVLWLGSSETIGAHRDLFDAEDPKLRFYVRRDSGPRLPVVDVTAARTAFDTMPAGRADAPRGPAAANGDLLRETDRLVLGRYAPPGVLVNDQLEIVQFRGDTSAYLAPAQGRASLNLLKMAREGLLVGLRSAIHRARREETQVRQPGLRVRTAAGWRDVDVEVIPLRRGGREAFLLVVFDEPRGAAAAPAGGTPQEAPAPPPGPAEGADADQVVDLTQELAATREYLQSVIEQQEAANEELQSANEEVQSTNEELQSINEELETSKEEIQSSNEELATVNDELNNRNLELSQTNNDLVNLISSVQMAIVMLGADLRIRRFTPAAEKLLNLIPADVGRPFSDIKLPIEVADLERRLAEVVDTVTVQEVEVRDRHGRWFLLRVRPYKTLENKIDGAVLAFVDVDALKRAQLAVQESEERYRLLVEGATGFGMMLLDREGRVVAWNAGAQRLFGYSEQEAAGSPVARFFLQADAAAGLAQRELHEAEARGCVVEERWMVRKDGSKFWASGTVTALLDPGGGVRGFSKVVQDVSDRRRLEEDLRARVEELGRADRRRTEFLAVLAHELRNPLAPVQNAVHILKEATVDEGRRAEARAIIERQVRHMTRLVDDLLDVARVTQGKIQLRTARIDLASPLQTAVADVRPQMDRRRQRLTVSLPPEPVWVQGDAQRLEQVFVNLLGNAAKFTGNGGSVDVRMERTRGEVRDSVTVRVRDDGIGMAPDTLPRVFDLFTQADSSAARTTGGLGIGLTLVRRIVELHGGTVEAHSDGLGRGSEFAVHLPTVADGHAGS